MDVSKLDEGEYTCIAKNKAGESEKELSLRVFGKTNCLYTVHTWTSDNETVKWSKWVGMMYLSMYVEEEQ